VTTPADIDLITVDRLIHGRTTPDTLNRAEKLYAAHILTADGQSAADIARLVGVAQRTVVRWRHAPAVLPVDEPEPGAWRDHAACAEVGPALFFAPDDEDDSPLYSTARARAICAHCPVRQACLDEAMTREGDASRHGRSGVWGGLTASQRAALATAQAKGGPG
jgi:WhiB family redox-sensing transcriptional regulator